MFQLHFTHSLSQRMRNDSPLFLPIVQKVINYQSVIDDRLAEFKIFNLNSPPEKFTILVTEKESSTIMLEFLLSSTSNKSYYYELISFGIIVFNSIILLPKTQRNSLIFSIKIMCHMKDSFNLFILDSLLLATPINLPSSLRTLYYIVLIEPQNHRCHRVILIISLDH